MYELLKTSPRSKARLGRLTTKRGTIDTPVFMPVGTQATVKALDLRELNEIGTEILLGNTYHLFLRPGIGHHPQGRRSASVHELGQADPHRQRRLSGL